MKNITECMLVGGFFTPNLGSNTAPQPKPYDVGRSFAVIFLEGSQ